MKVMRSVLVASLLGCVIVLTACGLTSPDEHPVKLTFINSSDSLLCFGTPVVSCDEVKPRGISVWAPGCGSGRGAAQNPIAVVLTVKEGGRRIYERSATCNEWEDSGGTFIIKQRGDEFIVTDALPDGTSSP